MKKIKNYLLWWWINRFTITGLLIVIAMLICVLVLLEQLIASI